MRSLRTHALRVATPLIGLAALWSAASAQQAAGDSDPRVDAIFAQWDRPDSPGCALGVYRDGEMIYARGYGMADLEHRVPIAPHTVFDIGSTSKQFAAASIVLLAHQGKLSLDDDVRRYVPELPAYSGRITIRHLLHHTSGLRDYIGLLTLAGTSTDDVATVDDALSAITRQKELNFEPGEEHLYSNSGYFLLSIIVERVAGASLRDFAREHIFEPLGMARTHYLGSYDDVVPDRAIGYSPRRGAGLRADMPRWLQLGDGAVFTTVEDLLHWDRNFYDPKVGGEAMVGELQTPGRLANGDSLSYALGLMLGEYRGQRTVSHNGSWGGYRAELVRFPEQRFSVAVLCNLGTINPSRLARDVAAVHLADVLEPETSRAVAAADRPAPAVHVPEGTLRRLAGSYRDPSTRVVRTIVFREGGLRLDLGPGYELRARSASEFELVGVPVQVTLAFEPAEAGAARRLRWHAAGQEPELFERIELATPTAAELAGYAGTFYSEELDAAFTLAVEGGSLVLRRPGADPQPVAPVIADEFTAGGMLFRFVRDGEPVTGFLLDLGRIRNLRFERVAAARGGA